MDSYMFDGLGVISNALKACLTGGDSYRFLGATDSPWHSPKRASNLPASGALQADCERIWLFHGRRAQAVACRWGSAKGLSLGYINALSAGGNSPLVTGAHNAMRH